MPLIAYFFVLKLVRLYKVKLYGFESKLESKEFTSSKMCYKHTYIPHRLVCDNTFQTTLFCLISENKKTKNRKPCHGNEFTPNFGLNKSVSTGITFPEES